MEIRLRAGRKVINFAKFGGSGLADVKCYLRVAAIWRSIRSLTEYSGRYAPQGGNFYNQLISCGSGFKARPIAFLRIRYCRRYAVRWWRASADVADDLTSAFISDLERLAALLDDAA